MEQLDTSKRNWLGEPHWSLSIQLAKLKVQINKLVDEAFDTFEEKLHGPDRLLSVQETAVMLGRDKRWIYRRSKHLPFVVREGRMISCSLHGVQKYMRARTNNP